MFQVNQLGLGLIIGVVLGVVAWTLALYLFPRNPRNAIGRLLRRATIKTLHGLTAAEAREVSAILLGGERIPSESVDRREGRLYVGKCACLCGQDVYYSGRGKRPKYVNRQHFDYDRGFRSSWD